MENNTMKVFIGSSSEAADKTNPEKNILLKVAGILRNAGVEPLPWNKKPSIFKAGMTTIENLEEIVEREQIMASVFIYSEDDKTWFRGEIQNVPRDNVVFEHGLFTGILGRKKAITIKVGNVKIPSDLHGLTCIDYSKNPEHAELDIMQWVSDLQSMRQVKVCKDEIDSAINQEEKTQEKETSTLGKDNSLVEFISIQQGTYYRMIDNKEVRINNSFAISKHLITQSVYNTVMRDNPSNFKGDTLPIENVTFYEAIAFCNKLSEQEGYKKVYSVNNGKIRWNKEVAGYRLPCEAEWEFALNFNSIKIEEKLDTLVWYNKNSNNQTQEVGLKEQNTLGLHDLLGNVWEWCFDSFVENPSIEIINNKGYIQNEDSTLRVLRGGSFADFETMFTKEKAFRKRENESIKNRFTGFRIVLQYNNN